MKFVKAGKVRMTIFGQMEKTKKKIKTAKTKKSEVSFSINFDQNS